MSELLSYKHILSDIKNFKKSGSQFGDEFNIYDTPAHKYFKILFYFGSTPEIDSNEYGSGLLAPTWEYATDELYNYNSAWAYLKLNDEEERAEKLEQFVTLLSDINSKSPWYFSTLGGIQEALERKVVDDGKLEMSENKKLTITCLPDAFDNRISTLLELYRDVTWSWIQKKEIIPANLKKFDMAVYIFETMTNNLHKDTDIIDTNNGYNVSYKMIEFHDCEFGYNSIKSGWNELNNSEGTSPKYTIDISYNDCYEISYNDIMMRTIGDVILTDMINSSKNDNDYISNPQVNDNSLYNEMINRIYPTYDNSEINKSNKIIYFGNLKDRPLDKEQQYITSTINEQTKVEYKPGFINNALGQVVGHLKSDLTDWVNKKILGNIFGFSLTQLRDQVSDFLQGNLIKTGMTAAQFAREKQTKNYKPGIPEGNIFPDSVAVKQKPEGDLFPDSVIVKKPKPIGNIFKTSIANNL